VSRTPRSGSGTDHGHVVQAELLKVKKAVSGADEPVRIKGAQIHYVHAQTLALKSGSV